MVLGAIGGAIGGVGKGAEKEINKILKPFKAIIDFFKSLMKWIPLIISVVFMIIGLTILYKIMSPILSLATSTISSFDIDNIGQNYIRR